MTKRCFGWTKRYFGRKERTAPGSRPRRVLRLATTSQTNHTTFSFIGAERRCPTVAREGHQLAKVEFEFELHFSDGPAPCVSNSAANVDGVARESFALRA